MRDVVNRIKYLCCWFQLRSKVLEAGAPHVSSPLLLLLLLPLLLLLLLLLVLTTDTYTGHSVARSPSEQRTIRYFAKYQILRLRLQSSGTEGPFKQK